MAYDLQSEAESAERRTSESSGMFKQGVTYRNMSAKNGPVIFRLLPACDQTRLTQLGEGRCAPVDPASWSPLRDPITERPMPFARIVIAGRYLGRTSSHVDLVSPTTFDPRAYCPISELYKAAKQYNRTWGYLVDKPRRDDRLPPNTPRPPPPALKKPDRVMLANAIIFTGPTSAEQVLAVFSSSSLDSLISPKNGLIWQQTVNVSPADLAADPSRKWTNGDITHPATGVLLQLDKEDERKGDMSGFAVRVFRGADGRGPAVPYPVPPQVLAARYNLLDLDSFLTRLSDQEIVDKLATVFNGMAPTGEHEYELLKMVFGGQFKVPEPPPRAAVPGWAIPASAPAPMGQPTAAGYPLPQTQPANPLAGMGQLPGLGPVLAPPAQQFQYPSQPVPGPFSLPANLPPPGQPAVAAMPQPAPAPAAPAMTQPAQAAPAPAQIPAQIPGLASPSAFAAQYVQPPQSPQK